MQKLQMNDPNNPSLPWNGEALPAGKPPEFPVPSPKAVAGSTPAPAGASSQKIQPTPQNDWSAPILGSVIVTDSSQRPLTPKK
jgi:hypothetical protein